MKLAICHYSFHRRAVAEKWTLDRFADEIKALGVEGIDFLTRMLPPGQDTPEAIAAAVKRSGAELSSLSLSSNFNQADPAEMTKQIDTIAHWIQVAAKLKAPVCRIFGGHVSADERKSDAARKAAWDRMIDGVGAVTRLAEKAGVLLAIENHGGLPCTGQEQVQVIKTINSPCLRATIDVGNYMGGGQEGHEGTAIAAPYCAYVHFKDNKKAPSADTPWGWQVEACTLGDGEVDLAKCVQILDAAGYKGYIGIEYEGSEDETTGVPRSVAASRKAMKIAKP